jgi:RNA polymerase sigma-70 factor, ECF subfamily
VEKATAAPALQDGGSADREEILAKLRERITGFAASRYSREVAEDLAQEVLLLLHEKYPHVCSAEELLPLSLQIVRFKIQALRRKVVGRGENSQLSLEDLPLMDPSENPGERLERKQTMERLRKAMEGAGERCREILRLKLEGRGFEEIRAALGAKSINTVYTWDHRCRQRMLELLGGSWEPNR